MHRQHLALDSDSRTYPRTLESAVHRAVERGAIPAQRIPGSHPRIAAKVISALIAGSYEATESPAALREPKNSDKVSCPPGRARRRLKKNFLIYQAGTGPEQARNREAWPGIRRAYQETRVVDLPGSLLRRSPLRGASRLPTRAPDTRSTHEQNVDRLVAIRDSPDAEPTHVLMAVRLLEMIRVNDIKVDEHQVILSRRDAAIAKSGAELAKAERLAAAHEEVVAVRSWKNGPSSRASGPRTSWASWMKPCWPRNGRSA